MSKHAADEPVPVGTQYAAGDPTPPTTKDKANAAAAYGLPPVLLGALIAVLDQAGVIFPDSDPVILGIIALVLVALGPIASYYGTYTTANKLKQPVTVTSDGVSEYVEDTSI